MFDESDWVIETGSNNRLGITFSGGKVGTCEADWANGAANLFKITYTIKAGTAARS